MLIITDAVLQSILTLSNDVVETIGYSTGVITSLLVSDDSDNVLY